MQPLKVLVDYCCESVPAEVQNSEAAQEDERLGAQVGDLGVTNDQNLEQPVENSDSVLSSSVMLIIINLRYLKWGPRFSEFSLLARHLPSLLRLSSNFKHLKQKNISFFMSTQHLDFCRS